MKLWVTAGFSGKKIWGGGGMSQKQGFLNLLKDLVINFYWICSIMKTYIIYCVSPQIPYLGKKFSEIWAKMLSDNQIAGFFNQPYLLNKSIKSPDFLHVDTSSHKSKVDPKFFGWTWSKIGMVSLVTGLWNWLYPKEWVNGMNWYFTCWCKFGNAKKVISIFGWAWSEMCMAISFMRP